MISKQKYVYIRFRIQNGYSRLIANALLHYTTISKKLEAYNHTEPKRQ